ncbi:hypothetical protein BDZ89DRAFT_1065132 [Hymenopellis radicata]|nr:hypothetical protein BDZ89DRAFT_1065132 [Hymenopellis radicata]
MAAAEFWGMQERHLSRLPYVLQFNTSETPSRQNSMGSSMNDVSRKFSCDWCPKFHAELEPGRMQSS